MTTRHVLEWDILFLLSCSVIGGIVFAMSFNHKPNIRSSLSFPVMQNFPNPSSTLVPTPKIETSSQISPDGSKNLAMKMIINNDTSKTYTFTTSDTTTANQQSIYSAILSNTENMSIPFNTWSPDNAYVFVQHMTASGSGVLVMKANGQPLTGGEQYLDVKPLFTAKITENTYQEVTGWASETLLIVNTKRQDGSKGPSYWFEVPSKAIIQLSTEF